MFDHAALESTQPGPDLAQALSDCDVSALTAEQLLDVARAAQRVAAWAESCQLDAVAAFADHRAPESEPDRRPELFGERAVTGGGPGTPEILEFAAEEVSAELGMSSFRAARVIADALDLRHRLPRVRQALVEGRIDGWRASIVANGTRRLSAPACAAMESDLLPRLDRITARRLRQAVDAALVCHGEDVAADELVTAEHEQYVRFGDSDLLGNKECWAVMAAGDAIRLDARIELVVDLMVAEARLTGAEVTATRGQLRAQALGMLADPTTVIALFKRVRALRSRSTGDAGPVPEPSDSELPSTVLYLHLRREDLLDHADGAATVEGSGHLPATSLPYQAIEEVLGHSHITIRPVIDLDHMAPGAGYAFTGDNREAVILKSLTCIFPFCDRPSRRCHTDHSIPAPLGPTSVDDGGPLCPRHHRVKTHGRWRLSQPFNGIYVWLSPTGHLYVVDNRATLRASNAA